MDSICPTCGSERWRDEVDIGVGTIYGLWHCDRCDLDECLHLGLSEEDKMTPEHRKNVLKFYLDYITKMGYLAQQQDQSQQIQVVLGDNFDPTKPMRHAAWMAERAIEFVDNNEIEKADRWLGHIQGILYALGFFSHNQEREHSRPPERGGKLE